MPTLKTALMLMAIGTIPCLAQIPEEFRTPAGDFTGYYWNSLTRGEKLAFLLGFRSGYSEAEPSNEPAKAQMRSSCLARFENPTPQQSMDCIIRSSDAKTEAYKSWEALDPLPGGTYGETIEATDRFFAEQKIE